MATTMNYTCPICEAHSTPVAPHVGASTEWLDVVVPGPTLRQSAFDVRPMVCSNDHYWDERELVHLHPANDWSVA